MCRDAESATAGFSAQSGHVPTINGSRCQASLFESRTVQKVCPDVSPLLRSSSISLFHFYLETHHYALFKLVLYHPSHASPNMRSPAIVFSLMAVTALSPTFVVGTPLPPVHSDMSTTDHHRSNTNSPRGLGFLNEIFTRAESDDDSTPPPRTRPKVATIAGYTIGYAHT